MRLSTKVISVNLLVSASMAFAPSVNAQWLYGGDLELNDPTPGIVFDDSDVGGWNWVIRGRGESFTIHDEANSEIYLSIDPETYGITFGQGAIADGLNSTAVGFRAVTYQPNSIVLGSIPGLNLADSYANVAIGTTDPLAPLHVARDDGTASILVTEDFPETGPRTLFEIMNNGNPEFRMTNTANDNSWSFSAGLRFVVKNDAGAWVMRVTDVGNLEIGGTVLEMSDRDRKHAITPLDAESMLEKVANIPVSEWSYQGEPADQRHIGPMAQDFYATFGLASGETSISARDMAGVNMAAIQALLARNEQLQAQVATLQSELAMLSSVTDEMAELRRLVGQLRPLVAQN